MVSSCGAHAACATASEYCASANDGTGRCRPCDECAVFADAIDGRCPITCATGTNATGAGATNSDEFFNAYVYWARVRDEGFSSNSTSTAGCVSAATEATKTTSGHKKGRTKGCAAVFTREDANKWCDVSVLTAEHPYMSCIASASNAYCGVRSAKVCIADGYFDCCPTVPGAIAGVSIAVAVVLMVLQYFVYKSCFTRKLIKNASNWQDARIATLASKTMERHPKLTERIMSRQRTIAAPAASTV